MTKGILGRKVGMTQVFAENGEVIPVTVIEAEPNVVLQKKSVESDGYEAIQIGFADAKKNQTNQKQAMLLKQKRLLSASLRKSVTLILMRSKLVKRLT